MVSPAAKIDSNITGLRYALEQADGTLPGSPIWYPVEPNSYDKFGGSIKTLARNPINDSRQRKKGVVVDLDAQAGFELDVTEDNTQQLMQSFLFAAMRTKAELAVATVADTTNEYNPAAGGAVYIAGNLLYAKNFTQAANNGLAKVSGTPTGTSVTVAKTLADETGAAGTISKVGHEFASGAVTVDVSGALPKLVFTSFDPTTLGLIPGEFINVGDDATAFQFAQAANNGLKRVKSIDSTSITIDKSTVAMVTDAGTGKTLRIFFGRVLKNEQGTLIKRQTVQFERTLGAPDLDQPTQIQAEYVTKCIADQLDVTIKTADKLTAKLQFMAADHETRTGAQGVKAGARPVIAEADAFNSTSHVARLSLNAIDPLSETPSELFAYLLDMSLTVKNNVKANKAIKYLGSFDHSAGTFEVDAKMTAYFSTVEAIQTVRDNADVTLDVTFASGNKGITFDLPLVTLATDGASVKQDEAIQLALDSQAATGAKVDINMNHTLLVVYWDYLPSLAA